MTSLDTRPLPIGPVIARPHEHAWLTESRHPTSDGTILYVRCSGCGARRVDVQARLDAPPSALSRDTFG